MNDRFFKRPVVLISAVVVLLQAAAKFALSVFGYGVLKQVTERDIYDIDIFELIIGVSLLLLYLFSRSNKPLDFPVKFMKVASIVELVIVIFLMCYALLAFIIITIAGVFSAGIMFLRFFPALLFSSAILIGFYAAFLTCVVSTVLLFVSQLVFAVSLKKDMTRKNHRSSAPRFYAVMSFINAALMISLGIIAMLINAENTLALTLALLISSPSCIFVGIMALKYSKA